jgi:hypothetical protein
MYISPNHPNPPRPAEPPQDTGRRVATFQRHGGEELRVSVAEWKGHQFVSIRVWAPGPDGRLWPQRARGVSIKLREVAGLAEALAWVAGQLGGDRRPDRGQWAPARRAIGPPGRGEFEEFAEGA